MRSRALGTSFTALVVSVLLATLVPGCQSLGRHEEPLPASNLSITARVEQRLHDDGSHPVVLAEFKNTAEEAMAFTETFGFGAYSWIGIRIRSNDGSLVAYPVEADLFRRPAYQCLESGESLRWELDLFDWPLQVGGREGGEKHSFELPPGKYHFQVQYSDGGASPPRCKPIQGVARSRWVPLTVQAKP